MRHSVYGKKLSRTKNQRTALFRGLIRSLILHGSIKTTISKAKAVKGLIDRLIVKSKKQTEASLAVVKSMLPQNDINQKLIKEIAPMYQNRSSGFTNMVRLGQRLGDGAMMVKLSWVEDKVEEKKEDKKEEI